MWEIKRAPICWQCIICCRHMQSREMCSWSTRWRWKRKTIMIWSRDSRYDLRTAIKKNNLDFWSKAGFYIKSGIGKVLWRRTALNWKQEGWTKGRVFFESSQSSILSWLLQIFFGWFPIASLSPFRCLGFSPRACLPRLLVGFSTSTGSAGGTSASRRFSTCTTLGMKANLWRLGETDRFKDKL